jgi:transcriptional regulator with XRE-family HTH domain
MQTPLRDARVSRDLTQDQLAELSGVSVATIIRAEKGRPLTPLNEARLARALKRSRKVLFPEQEAVS